MTRHNTWKRRKMSCSAERYEMMKRQNKRQREHMLQTALCSKAPSMRAATIKLETGAALAPVSF